MSPSLNLAQIEKNLDKRQHRYLSQLKRTSSHAKKLLLKNKLNAKKLRENSTKILASAGLTGALLLSPLQTSQSATPSATTTQTVRSVEEQLQQDLSPITPHSPTKLSPEDAQKLTNAIKADTGITATPYLEGQSLNHNVGYVGYEQHLKRFPGDDISLHDDELVAGIAPGLGAWGYFAPSRERFTTQDYLHEKWYSVAQTLYLPNWNSDFKHLRDWYKYRKILIVNPATGEAVVTVLADSGPAEWTGKQFGASPEAMKAISLHKGPRKGLVVFFFVDDPNDQIPLGPVTGKINI